MEIPRALENKINKTESCWLWTGHINNVGYSRYNSKDFASGYVHRQMFYIANGYLPEPPNVVGHLCEVRNCVNPKHLTEQTQSANVRQYTDKRVACPKGHTYDEKNTYIRKNGARKCRACHADAMRQKRGQ
jgi:hypothetical protein